MAEPHYHLSHADRKTALIAELAQARSQMDSSYRDTQGNLEVARTAASRKAVWIAGAAAGGWLLGRLTGRKSSRRKTKTAAITAAPLQQVERTGWMLALLGAVGTMLRPAITSYVTHRLNDFLTRMAENHHSQGPMR